MANDSLSGVLLAAFLARTLAARPARQWSYRFVFVPETIGAIAYCALNEDAMRAIDIGLVATTVGGRGKLGYKQSWDPRHAINRHIEAVLKEAGRDYNTYPFDIHGSDERQYSTQGFRINCATICKDRYYEYPEYHSSLDDLSLVTGKQIEESLEIYIRLIDRLEARRIYRNLISRGEVMLSRHDLYPPSGGAQRPELGGRSELDLILWLLFYCDGRLALDDIAASLCVEVELLEPLVSNLVDKGVLHRV
jgi:aminopeptidase-like protein